MGAQQTKPTAPNVSAPPRRNAVDLSQLQARIDRVHVSGLLRTHDDYVQRAVRNCFRAATFQDVLLEVSRTRSNLAELGAFKDVHANIEVSKHPDATANGYEVTFNATELSRITGSVGTEVGNQEGSLTAQVRAPNLFGRGESLSLHGSYSSCKSTDVNVKLSKPFLHTALHAYRPHIALSLFKTTSAIPWYRYTTHDLGVNLEYAFLLPLPVAHSLQLELALREVGHVGRLIPFHVREHCGPRLQTVLRHVGTFDDRDSRIFPTRGCLVQTTNELSGLAGTGNVQYVKSHVHAELNVPLRVADVSLQLCGRAGIVRSDPLTDEKVPLANLFVLGGPLTVRGFQMAGVGEHRNGVPCGAHSYWAAAAHLWSPLPFVRRGGALAEWFRVHGWTTVGNVDRFDAEGLRCSVGAGLAVSIGESARIEFNYCKPLLAGPTDATLKEGFQFGIGVEFL